MGCARMTGKGRDSAVFICGPGVEPCHVCGAVATAYCDYPVGGGKTCDIPLCDRHRIRQNELHDIDFCPAHALIASGKARPPADDRMDSIGGRKSP